MKLQSPHSGKIRYYRNTDRMPYEVIEKTRQYLLRWGDNILDIGEDVERALRCSPNHPLNVELRDLIQRRLIA